MKQSDYWQKKLSLWLHDPVCKVFDIKNHEAIATRIAELLYQSVQDKDLYQAADVIASSLTRAMLPRYDEGGSIDFSGDTQIVHPLVKENLPVDLPKVEIESLCDEIEALLKKDIGLNKSYEELQNLPEEEKSLNAYFNYKDKPEDWAKALYNYLFFAFQRQLRNENVGGLGSIWDILPADTRMPDHPLWHHLGLVSAIDSSLSEDSNQQVDMVVFSITPVQNFIAKARKLRDYWSGSVLLSYLSFTGITSVMENLGPDHIVYPSLHNQPLVDSWIKEKYRISSKFLEEKDNDLKDLIDDTKGIAAFPNKFIFLSPHDKVKEMTKEVSDAIINKWEAVSLGVKEYIQDITKSGKKFSSQWDIQIKDFWKISWGSAKLAELKDKENIEKLVSGDVVEKEFKVLKDFSDNFAIKSVRLYTSTHSLIQSVLAAGKSKTTKISRPQYGIKCPLCGEREVLNDFDLSGSTSAKEYSNSVNGFWQKLEANNNNTIHKGEKLCAICAVKRFLPILSKDDSKNYSKDSILREVFKSNDKFPSTTEMASKNFMNRLTKKIPINSSEYKNILNYLHNADNELEDTTDTEQLIKSAAVKFTDKDKYYAVLLMDGDKMGDLINGETLEATWEDVLHPNLAKRINDGTVNSNVLKNHFSEKRTLNPALHAMISDSLNNFARFGVQPAIKNANGKLIYAGGDDVCAVLPLETAVSCAKKISESYTLSFAEYTKDGAGAIKKLEPSMKKIGYHLGSGAEGISLSGAVIIAHHKQPLREVIQDAHRVLDDIAKEKTGRNAIAIRLKKRSGGDRDFSCKWNELNLFDSSKTVFQSFENICNAAKDEKISTSLLYRMQDLEQSFSPLLEATEDNKKRILQLLRYELLHSGVKIGKENAEEYVKDLAGISFQKGKETNRLVYNFEATIIANFLGDDKR